MEVEMLLSMPQMIGPTWSHLSQFWAGQESRVVMANSTLHIIGATAEPGTADARAQTAGDNHTGRHGN